MSMTEGEARARRHGMNCAATTPGHESECTCGLEWRDKYETERTMHNAWRKRAEEAEAENAKQRTGLNLAREWGLRGKAYDAAFAMALSKWIDSGMKAELPPVPDYLKSEAAR